MTSRRNKTLPRLVFPFPDANASRVHGTDDADMVRQGRGTGPARSFRDVLVDLSQVAVIPVPEGVLIQAVGTPLRDWVRYQMLLNERLMAFDDDYGYVMPMTDGGGNEIGLMAVRGDDLDEYRIAGVLTGKDLMVDETLRGHGLGQALVAAQLLYRGELPDWSEEDPAGSPLWDGCLIAGLDLAKRLSGEPSISNDGP